MRAFILVASVLFASIVFAAGCCLSGGECDPNAVGPSLTNFALYLPRAPQTSTATVENIDGPKVTLRIAGSDYLLWIGPASAALIKGQSVRFESCDTWMGPNDDRYVVLRDETGDLLVASTGQGWAALDAKCIPPEFSVARHEPGCCSRGTDCGDHTPFSIRVTAETSATIHSGQTAILQRA
jgi:hypothetical protein